MRVTIQWTVIILNLCRFFHSKMVWCSMSSRTVFFTFEIHWSSLLSVKAEKLSCSNAILNSQSLIKLRSGQSITLPSTENQHFWELDVFFLLPYKVSSLIAEDQLVCTLNFVSTNLDTKLRKWSDLMSCETSIDFPGRDSPALHRWSHEAFQNFS